MSRLETDHEANLRMQHDLDRVDWRGDGCIEALGERKVVEEVTEAEPLNIVYKEGTGTKR